jgi:CubicO group peptidase (beta-lactamase class C family)
MTNGDGFRAGSFERIDEIVRAAVADGQTPGVVAAVGRGRTGTGHVAVAVAGVMTVGGPPMRADTLFRISSITKPMTAAVVLSLIDDGGNRPRPTDVHLGFRDAGGHVTPDPDTWMARLGELPLLAQPGERWLYQAGSQVLGVLAARAAGAPFEEVMRRRLLDPLGLRDTGFHRTDTARLATAYERRDGQLVVNDPPDGQWSRPPAFPDGGGGLVSTAADVLAFGRMLLRGGATVLRPATVAEMTRDQLTAEQRDRDARRLRRRAGRRSRRRELGRGHRHHGAVRVVQHRVGDRAGAARAGVPADDDQVGAGGQACQRPARVAVDDVLADRDAGVLIPPTVEQRREPASELVLDCPRAGRRQGFKDLRVRRPRRVPGVHGQQAGVAQGGLFEREGQRGGTGFRIPHADGNLPLLGRALVADDHHRARGVGGGVPADRPEHQRRERTGTPGADDQHQRARSALGHRLGRRSRQLIGVNQQVGSHLRGACGRRGQSPVAVLGERVGHTGQPRTGQPRTGQSHTGQASPGQSSGVPILRHHPRRHGHRGYDPERSAAQDGFPGGPSHRAQ